MATRRRTGVAKRRRTGLAAIVALAVWAVAVPAAVSAHKFYMSLTVVDHNTAEKSLEFTLRLFADDLEAAVSRRGTPLKHGQAGFDQAVFAYVQQGVVVKRANGAAVPLTWVGLENKVDVTWVYVEAKGVESTAGLTVRDAIFQELFAEQVNMLHVNDARGRRALDFRSGDGFKPF